MEKWNRYTLGFKAKTILSPMDWTKLQEGTRWTTLGERESRMRQKSGEQFKAKIALEAVKEELTLQELARKQQVHPNQISALKEQLPENSASLFVRKNRKDEEQVRLRKEKQELYNGP